MISVDIQQAYCELLSEADRLRYAHRDDGLMADLGLTSIWYNDGLLDAWRHAATVPNVSVCLIIAGRPRRAVGTVSMTCPSANPGVREVGFAVATPYRKNGLASQALRSAIKSVSLDSAAGLTLIAYLSADNVASRKVLHSAGFKKRAESARLEIETWVLTLSD